jgi:Uma2 family endonuclease
MSRASADYEFMSLDDFDEALADKPRTERWELIGGRVVRMMVGARWEHAAIIQNIARHLGNAFDAAGSGCRTFTESLYLRRRELDAALLPHVMVVCGDLEPGATATDAPVVLFEVMSPGTEARDRFDKWHIYQRLPSLRHYVLVARDRPHVEAFDRVGEAWSGMRVLDGFDAVLDLPAVDAKLSLSDIYRRVLPP